MTRRRRLFHALIGLAIQTAAPRTASRSWAAPARIPAPLLALEEAAEAVPESLGNAKKLHAAVASVQREAPAAERALEQGGATAEVRTRLLARVSALQAALATGDANATARAATEVSLALADAFDAFHPDRPTDLDRIETLSVRVPLELDAGRTQEATLRSEELAACWSRLQKRTPPRAAVVARRMSAAVEQLVEATRKGLEVSRAAARRIGDLVDELETVFPEP